MCFSLLREKLTLETVARSVLTRLLCLQLFPVYMYIPNVFMTVRFRIRFH